MTTKLETIRIPPLSDHNAWADFWYYEIGANVIPAHTQKKKTFMEWKRWQTESIPEELHDQWKRENKFEDGLAIIVGKVWRGEHIGECLIFIDCDNLKAIEKFCTKDGQTYSLKQVAEKYIVEQHPDDTNKAHIFFYSEIPFTKKSSDINVIRHPHKIKNEEVPAFEVKGQGTHGIAYCTPSVHKNGERYQIVGTARPVKLSEEAAHKMMEHIDAICRKYGLQYLENDNGNGNALVPIRDLFKEDFVIHEGHNRHLALLRAMDSLVKRNAGILSLEEVKELAYKWNQKHCSPPLDDVSFERQWKDATKYIVPTLESDSSRTTEPSIEEKDEDDEDDEEEKKRTAKAKKALELAIENSQELFVNEFGMAFAAVKVNGHIEVHPMDEQHFKNWISGIYYQRNDDLLSEEDLKKIVRILKAKAEFPSNGVSRHRLDVRVRGYNKRHEEEEEEEEEKRFQDEYDNDSVGSDGGVNGSSVGCVYSSNDEITENFDAIYYDLTNKRWEAVKITPEGWEIDKHPPILFRRYGSERPQPYPDRNYEPDIFDRFLDLVNLKAEHKDMQKQLLKPLIVSMFWSNTTPKPILILPAAQGSAKTTAFELIRDLADPNTTLTTSLPKEDFNLKQNLAHNFVSFFDNVSEITDSQSDILCRAVTGASDMKRKLYENDEDIIYNYRRIIGLNGISNAATRADLLDRGLIFVFEEIPRRERKLLRVIWRKYLELKPKLLAFCLDVLAEVMKERQKWQGVDEDFFGMEDLIMQKGGLPRMADWAILAEQIAVIVARKEGKTYEAGTFLEVFDKNLEILNTEALKSSLVAEALIAFMTEREAMNRGVVDTAKYGNSYPHYEGSPTMLLADLNEFIEKTPSVKINTRSKAWAQDPATFGKEITRIAPNLRALGVIIDAKRTNKNIIYTITKVPTLPTLPTLLDNPRSHDGSKMCREPCKEPTHAPTPKEGENHAQNGDSVGSVGSVGKTSNLGGSGGNDDDHMSTIVNKAMLDSQGNNKGYFDMNDWKTVLMSLPIQHPYYCDEDQAEQTLYALLEDGKIQEIELGRYTPAI